MKKFLTKYWMLALFDMVFGTILYSLMMSQQLTNTFDGLWNQNYHHAGIPELTSGRWMLYFIDKISMGLHAEPLTSLVTLGLFILGFLFVLELIGTDKRSAAFLALALWISSTAVSNTLSYRMTSIGTMCILKLNNIGAAPMGRLYRVFPRCFVQRRRANQRGFIQQRQS